MERIPLEEAVLLATGTVSSRPAWGHWNVRQFLVFPFQLLFNAEIVLKSQPEYDRVSQ